MVSARATQSRSLRPRADEDLRERMAELGDAGRIEFEVDEKAGLIRV